MTVTVNDGNGGTASIDVTIDVTDVDEGPPPSEIVHTQAEAHHLGHRVIVSLDGKIPGTDHYTVERDGELLEDTMWGKFVYYDDDVNEATSYSYVFYAYDVDDNLLGSVSAGLPLEPRPASKAGARSTRRTSPSTTTTGLGWRLHPAFTAGGAASFVGAAGPLVT